MQNFQTARIRRKAGCDYIGAYLDDKAADIVLIGNFPSKGAGAVAGFKGQIGGHGYGNARRAFPTNKSVRARPGG